MFLLPASCWRCRDFSCLGHTVVHKSSWCSSWRHDCDDGPIANRITVRHPLKRLLHWLRFFVPSLGWFCTAGSFAVTWCMRTWDKSHSVPKIHTLLANDVRRCRWLNVTLPHHLICTLLNELLSVIQILQIEPSIDKTLLEGWIVLGAFARYDCSLIKS